MLIVYFKKRCEIIRSSLFSIGKLVQTFDETKARKQQTEFVNLGIGGRQRLCLCLFIHFEPRPRAPTHPTVAPANVRRTFAFTITCSVAKGRRR